MLAKFQTTFLEKRREGLAYFLKSVAQIPTPERLLNCGSCVLLNPEFAGSPVLKDFVFT
jgi:hypothetical protein